MSAPWSNKDGRISPSSLDSGVRFEPSVEELCFGGVPRDFVNEALSHFRRRNPSLKNGISGHISAINGLVIATQWLDDRSIQTHTSKHTAAA